ncbi:MAG: hypothetical protein HY293_17925 [Planctomycetes bacterium]|nr:hypothetical protein [Planctomycetota bacterium]
MRRIAPLFIALAAACSGKPADPSPLDVLVRDLTRLDRPQREESLAGYLRKQGRDLEPYLGFPGYSGGYAMRIWEALRLKIEGRPCVVVKLELSSFSIPGDCAVRLVLIDEFGKVADVATAVWPSRLERRFQAEVVDAPGPDNVVLRFRDDSPEAYWGNFDPPHFDLHEKAVRTLLPWTGTRVLGDLRVEKGRFGANRLKK